MSSSQSVSFDYRVHALGACSVEHCVRRAQTEVSLFPQAGACSCQNMVVLCSNHLSDLIHGKLVLFKNPAYSKEDPNGVIAPFVLRLPAKPPKTHSLKARSTRRRQYIDSDSDSE